MIFTGCNVLETKNLTWEIFSWKYIFSCKARQLGMLIKAVSIKFQKSQLFLPIILKRITDTHGKIIF